jgi:hypothetical protein
MEQETTQRSLLGDLSLTQIIAGAAASATSFALAKQTGILGSVIGAAVGSIAATIAGAVFTNMINRSVEGIRGFDAADDYATQSSVQPGSAMRPTRRSHKHALIALAIAMVAGLAAVWVYATGVDIFTAGRGIGTQAPVIEYVMAPQDYQTAPEEEPVESETDGEIAPEDSTATDTESTPEGTEPTPDATEGGSANTTGTDGAADTTGASETGSVASTNAPATNGPAQG